MKVYSGWAEFVEPMSGQAVARGRLYVLNPPLPCSAYGHWEGEVTLLRSHDALRAGDSHAWLLRFGEGQVRWIGLTSVVPSWSASGLHATAQIVSYDDRFPAEVVELGGDG